MKERRIFCRSVVSAVTVGTYQYSPRRTLGIVGPLLLHYWFNFDGDWGGASGLDVVTSSTQNVHNLRLHFRLWRTLHVL